MKKIVFSLAVGSLLMACNASVTTEEKLDSLGSKIETTAEKAWDSTKANAKELKDKIENKLDKAGDSLDKKEDSIDRKN